MTGAISVEDACENVTNVEYVRIGHASTNVSHPYFHRECWSSADAGFVFRSADEVWYFDIASRKATPLSGRAGGRIGPLHVARDGQRLFFVRGQQLCVMPLMLDGDVEVLYEIDVPQRPCEISPNADDSGVALMVELKGLLRRICYVDPAAQTCTTCFEGHRRLGHLQMSPVRRDLILFADQNDHENFQRMYTVRTCGREHFPFYNQQPGEWVTHECFSRDGQWVTFTEAEPIKGLHIIRADGRDARQVAAGRYWHACPSSDASLVVADMYDGEVRLVQRDNGDYRVVSPHWTPDRSMVSDGACHPHPCLSRTGRWVLHVDGSSGRGLLRLIDVSTL
jgi:hypothetical protein